MEHPMTATFTTRPGATGLPFLALLAGGVAVGFSPIFVRLADVGPLASAFYRLALALPFLWLLQAMLPASRTQGREAAGGDHLLLIAAGAAFGLDMVCWHLSLFNTSVADATLIANTAPIMVAIAAAFLFGQRMTPLFMAGLALAVAGVASLALQKAGGPEPPNRLLGDAYAIGAAVSYAAYLLLVAHLRQRQGTRRIVMYSTAVSALMLLPLALLASPALWPASLYGWSILAGLALVSHVGGQLTLTYALAHLPAAFSSMTQLMQAAVAAIAAWAILAEPLTAMKLASATAILIGIVICRMSGTRL
jgi:drug/metabolite transporter (DMT)-like permease